VIRFAFVVISVFSGAKIAQNDKSTKYIAKMSFIHVFILIFICTFVFEILNGGFCL